MALQPNVVSWCATSAPNLCKDTSTSTLLSTTPQALFSQGTVPAELLLLNASAATHRAEDPPFYPGAASSPLTVMSFPPPPPPPAFLPNTTQSNIPHGAAALSHTHGVMLGHASLHAHQQQYHPFHHHHNAHAASSAHFNVFYPVVQTTPLLYPSLAVQVAAQPPSLAQDAALMPPSTGQHQAPELANTERVAVAEPHTGHRHNSGPRQLMITFLDPEVTNAELHAAFALIGPVDTARVIYDKASGISKCFGFVYYRLAKDAATAMQCMSGHPIRGRRIKVTLASPQRPTSPKDV